MFIYLIVSSSSMSSNARSSRGQAMMNSTAKRVRSNSPVAAAKHDDEQVAIKSEPQQQQQQQQQSQAGGGDEPVTKINIDNEEPIRLSKFSGGYEVVIFIVKFYKENINYLTFCCCCVFLLKPDPQTPRKIESLDWPAPPYPAAVPELRARSRSSSNRHGHSTVHSVDGGGGVTEQCLDDSDEDEDDLEVRSFFSFILILFYSHYLGFKKSNELLRKQ